MRGKKLVVTIFTTIKHKMINQGVSINLKSECNNSFYEDFETCLIFQLNILNGKEPIIERSRKSPVRTICSQFIIVEHSARFWRFPLISIHLSELAWFSLCSFQPTLFIKEHQLKKKISGKCISLVPSKTLCIPQAQLKWNTVSQWGGILKPESQWFDFNLLKND